MPEEENKSHKEPRQDKLTQRVLISKRSSGKLANQRIDSEPQTPTASDKNKPLVINRD